MQDILLSYNAVGIFEHWELSMQLFDARVKSPVEHWDADVSKNPGVSEIALVRVCGTASQVLSRGKICNCRLKHDSVSPRSCEANTQMSILP